MITNLDEMGLIRLGLSLGCLHILTGPDHISALATISANIDNAYTAFTLGVQWGYGHSTGLLGVALLFSLLSTMHSNDTFAVPQQASNCFEALVGIFLIVLGVHALIRARQKRRVLLNDSINKSTTDTNPLLQMQLYSIDEENQRKEEKVEENSRIQVSTTDYGSCTVPIVDCRVIESTKIPMSTMSTNDVVKICNMINCVDHCHCQHPTNTENIEVPIESSFCNTDEIDNANENVVRKQESTCHDHSHGYHHACHVDKDTSSSRTTRIVSFGTGIIHGLAGPGGVLGVLPAIQLHNVRLAMLYLSCFCFSSIITLGVFSTVYAHFSHSISKTPTRAFVVEVVSAWFSVLVGIMWLVLLYQGTLDDFFD